MTAARISDDVRAVEEALAAGLTAVDAGRRVGWAKAFAALDRVDVLEEQVRQLTDERTALRRAYSRLIGFVSNLEGLGSEITDAEVALHAGAEQTFRDESAWGSGKDQAMRHNSINSDHTRAKDTHRSKRRQYVKQGLARLRRQASSLGHRTQKRAVGDAAFEPSCSCGARSDDPGTYWDAIYWGRAHAVEVVHGIPYRKFMAQLKAEGRRRASAEVDLYGARYPGRARGECAGGSQLPGVQGGGDTTTARPPAGAPT